MLVRRMIATSSQLPFKAFPGFRACLTDTDDVFCFRAGMEEAEVEKYIADLMLGG